MVVPQDIHVGDFGGKIAAVIRLKTTQYGAFEVDFSVVVRGGCFPAQPELVIGDTFGKDTAAVPPFAVVPTQVTSKWARVVHGQVSAWGDHIQSRVGATHVVVLLPQHPTINVDVGVEIPAAEIEGVHALAQTLNIRQAGQLPPC